MASSMVSSAARSTRYLGHSYNGRNGYSSVPRMVVASSSQQPKQEATQQQQVGRRELMLRSSEIAVLGAIFHFGFLMLTVSTNV